MGRRREFLKRILEFIVLRVEVMGRLEEEQLCLGHSMNKRVHRMTRTLPSGSHEVQ